MNIDKNGVALEGYNPVAYFTDGKPDKGSPHVTASYKGATYQFASAGEKQLFEKSPAKYEPQFGGFCGYAASHRQTGARPGRTFRGPARSIDFEAQQEGLGPLAHRDIEGNLKKAGANWPTLSQQKAL